MLKICTILVLCLAFAASKDCFGADCTHRSPVFQMAPVDPVEVSNQIEAELRRQYWYYLRDSSLIYQANLNMPGRLMIFYFHRNIVGTFFTICSWHFEEAYSEVNTMVRLGAGSQQGISSNTSPVSIDPFVLTFRLSEGEKQVVFTEQGELLVDGVKVSVGSGDLESAQACYLRADKYLRSTYWYYLNRATEIDHQTLATTIRNYVLITYSNVVGTFLVISSCQEDHVKANTFVRLGPGSIDPSQPIVIEPIILENQPDF